MGLVSCEAKGVLLVDLLEEVHIITEAELFRGTEENQEDLIWNSGKRRESSSTLVLILYCVFELIQRLP